MQETIDAGWARHADDPEGVLASLEARVGELTGAHAAFAGLATHVAGEHLAQWDRGLALLERVAAQAAGTADAAAVARSRAVLARCAGRTADFERWLAEGATGHPRSDRARVLAVAASALAARGRLDEARTDFDAAVESLGEPARDDPAARALAATANNLAVALEQLPERDEAQRALMVRAAAVARLAWGAVGGWLEAERAEYRLSRSHAIAGDAATARRHAEECLRIVVENDGDAGETFFAHEALAHAALAGGDRATAERSRAEMERWLPEIADAGFRAYAEAQLARLSVTLR